MAYLNIYTIFNLKLLKSLDSKYLKLTRMDDDIYEEFRKAFKKFDVANINLDSLKSNEAKEVRFIDLSALNLFIFSTIII